MVELKMILKFSHKQNDSVVDSVASKGTYAETLNITGERILLQDCIFIVRK